MPIDFENDKDVVRIKHQQGLVNNLLKSEINHYAILGVEQGASADEIKSAYKALSRKFHPDKNGDQKQDAEAIFKVIGASFHNLEPIIQRKEAQQSIQNCENLRDLIDVIQSRDLSFTNENGSTIDPKMMIPTLEQLSKMKAQAAENMITMLRQDNRTFPTELGIKDKVVEVTEKHILQQRAKEQQSAKASEKKANRGAMRFTSSPVEKENPDDKPSEKQRRGAHTEKTIPKPKN